MQAIPSLSGEKALLPLLQVIGVSQQKCPPERVALRATPPFACFSNGVTNDDRLQKDEKLPAYGTEQTYLGWQTLQREPTRPGRSMSAFVGAHRSLAKAWGRWLQLPIWQRQNPNNFKL